MQAMSMLDARHLYLRVGIYKCLIRESIPLYVGMAQMRAEMRTREKASKLTN